MKLLKQNFESWRNEISVQVDFISIYLTLLYSVYYGWHILKKKFEYMLKLLKIFETFQVVII